MKFGPEYYCNSVVKSRFDELNEIPQEIKQGVPKKESLVLEFAREELLKDFLINRWIEIPEFKRRNLHIHGGLETGVEYDTGIAGRIDILPENDMINAITIIDLKRGISGERHLEQLLRYMGWIRSKLSF